MPTAVITPGGPTTFCDGNQVQLNASSATSYAWNSGSSAAFISVSSSGTFTLTATYANGCTSVSTTVSVTVIPNTSNTTQVTDCESYTWAVNGITYTQSGTYTNLSVCHTEILQLTLEKPRFTTTPSPISRMLTPGILLPAYTVAVTGGSGHTFQWYRNTTNSNTGGTVIPGEQSDTYLPPTQTAGTLYYYYCVTTTSNGCIRNSPPSGMVQVCGQ